MNKSEISDYKLNAINKNSAVFKTDYSYIKSSKEHCKNVVYVTVGYLVMYGAVNGSYERLILERQDRFIQSLWIRVGAGKYAMYGDEAANYVVTLTALTGKRDEHLEFGLGATYISKGRFEYVPAFTLGYRYQKPLGHFVFRTGIGYPEFIYLSLGLCF
jgi:hypothetical protein